MTAEEYAERQMQWHIDGQPAVARHDDTIVLPKTSQYKLMKAVVLALLLGLTLTTFNNGFHHKNAQEMAADRANIAWQQRIQECRRAGGKNCAERTLLADDKKPGSQDVCGGCTCVHGVPFCGK